MYLIIFCSTLMLSGRMIIKFDSFQMSLFILFPSWLNFILYNTLLYTEIEIKISFWFT